MNDDRYRPIGHYGFLSDCHSTALVSREGSIDWACFRRFDAGSAFGRLLDARKGGHFSVGPVGEVIGVERRYLDDTLVLVTTTTTDGGTVRCTDAFAMAPGGASRETSELLRRVECIQGTVDIDVVIEPRFEYGAIRPWLRRHADDRYTAVGGSDALVIHATTKLEVDRDRCRFTARTTLEVGERLEFGVVGVAAHLVERSGADGGEIRSKLATTQQWWTAWSERTDVGGEYREHLNRSALVLKGLTCAPTGAIIAAPTTSLPEVVGGSANWDYRYSWIRDSTLALAALAEVGHDEVAQGFRDFLMRSSAGQADELQIMYGPYGERSLPERELELEGWRGSSPVRAGNGAATQTQLDVYGHLLGAAHLWHGRGSAIERDEWAFLTSLVDQAATRRNDADAGMWEMRGRPRHFVQSKVMIWVALDRGIRLVEEHGFAHHAYDRWRTARDTVRREIETRGVDPERGNFVQHYGTTEVDASLLTLPLVGFVDADDERMRITTDVVMEELGVGPHGFLRRYRHPKSRDPEPRDPDAAEPEGIFLLCSFWLVEVLALQGRSAEATSLFRALTALGNDLGLFSEEYDVGRGELLGNFPQAFTHLGLISAERRLRTMASHRSGTGGETP